MTTLTNQKTFSQDQDKIQNGDSSIKMTQNQHDNLRVNLSALLQIVQMQNQSSKNLIKAFNDCMESQQAQQPLDFDEQINQSERTDEIDSQPQFNVIALQNN